MAGKGGDFADRPALPVIEGVPEIDLVETVPVGGDHFVGDAGKGEVAYL
jgi:hypothetical protein